MHVGSSFIVGYQNQSSDESVAKHWLKRVSSSLAPFPHCTQLYWGLKHGTIKHLLLYQKSNSEAKEAKNI